MEGTQGLAEGRGLCEPPSPPPRSFILLFPLSPPQAAKEGPWIFLRPQQISPHPHPHLPLSGARKL